MKLKSHVRNEKHFIMGREKEHRFIVRLPGASTGLRQGSWNYDIHELILYFII
jgi:hypothetical protein